MCSEHEYFNHKFGSNITDYKNVVFDEILSVAAPKVAKMTMPGVANDNVCKKNITLKFHKDFDLLIHCIWFMITTCLS